MSEDTDITSPPSVTASWPASVRQDSNRSDGSTSHKSDSIHDILLEKHFQEHPITRYRANEGPITPYDVLNDLGFTILKLSGSGAYGMVYKVELANQIKGENLAALKIINLPSDDTSILKTFRHEVFMLDKVKECPHVLRFFGAFIIDNEAYITLEYGNAGNFYDYLFARKEPLKEQRARRYFSQMASAIDFMHSKGIAHRDVKLENTMLFKYKDKKSLCKLADFGFSRVMYTPEMGFIMKSRAVGTKPYFAPEIIMNRINPLLHAEYHPMPPDIWSLGVALYIMLTMTYPFEFHLDMEAMLELQRRVTIADRFVKTRKELEYELDTSDECMSMLSELLEVDNEKRIKADAILNHQWIKNQS